MNCTLISQPHRHNLSRQSGQPAQNRRCYKASQRLITAVGQHGQPVCSNANSTETLDQLDVLLDSLKQQQPRDDLLRCIHCYTPITHKSEQTEFQGQHLFRFSNPQGIIFTIACFGAAPGCLIHGNPNADHSWFPPYKWQFSSCEHCHEHLGWYYQSFTKSFFGLIADKLVR